MGACMVGFRVFECFTFHLTPLPPASAAAAAPPRGMEPPRSALPLRRTSSASAPTNLLNKYELGRLLGRGSFAKVYVGRDLTNDAVKDKLVAVKVIDKTRTEAAMEPKIICEISAMRRLQHHPNVLKIHEVMATKTKIFLVMELASGGDLFSKVVHRGKLKESVARRYIQQLVSALHYCHQHGIAHRDVKPQNLLLDEKGILKVSDFGLSALADGKSDGSSMLHTVCGTPGFTAPEVMTRRGGGGYDGAKADAWSCGVILFFLLSASLPFDDSNMATLYKRMCKREYVMPSWISKPAKSIIKHLLDPNPKSRMSIESLMRHSWFVRNIELPNQSGVLELDHMKSCKREGLVSGVNAFDIISMSSGLDLSGLFEVENKRDKRFTSKETGERIRERVKEVGGRFGYKVLEGKGIGAIGLGKGKVVLVFEVLEISESLYLVEVRTVESGGGWLDSEEVHWGELKHGLEDVVFQWHSDAV